LRRPLHPVLFLSRLFALADEFAAAKGGGLPGSSRRPRGGMPSSIRLRRCVAGELPRPKEIGNLPDASTVLPLEAGVTQLPTSRGVHLGPARRWLSAPAPDFTPDTDGTFSFTARSLYCMVLRIYEGKCE
jgi:hypothetical protein